MKLRWYFKLQDDIASSIVRAIRDRLDVAMPSLATALEDIALLEEATAHGTHFARASGPAAPALARLAPAARPGAPRAPLDLELHDRGQQARKAPVQVLAAHAVAILHALALGADQPRLPQDAEMM